MNVSADISEYDHIRCERFKAQNLGISQCLKSECQVLLKEHEARSRADGVSSDSEIVRDVTNVSSLAILSLQDDRGGIILKRIDETPLCSRTEDVQSSEPEPKHIDRVIPRERLQSTRTVVKSPQLRAPA